MQKNWLKFSCWLSLYAPHFLLKGINEIGNIIKKTKIVPDYINVGGGFPTIYPDLIPQSLDSYFNEIKKSLENLKINKLPGIT